MSTTKNIWTTEKNVTGRNIFPENFTQSQQKERKFLNNQIPKALYLIFEGANDALKGCEMMFTNEIFKSYVLGW